MPQNNTKLLRAKTKPIEIILGAKATLPNVYIWSILKEGEDFYKR